MNENLFMTFSDIMPVGVPVVNQSEDDKVPKEIILLRVGKTPYRIGSQDGEFDVDEDSIHKIINDFKSKNRKLVVDYDHNTLNDESTSKGDAPAAGWMKELIYDPVKGLVAIMDGWTDKAKQLIANKEYGYFSPVLEFDDSGKPISLHSCAITNHPAFKNNPALLAANDFSRMKNVESIQTIIKDCIKSSVDVNRILKQALDDYKSYVGSDASLLGEMQAFNDSNVVDMFAPESPMIEASPMQQPVVEIAQSVPDSGSDTDIVMLINEINTVKASTKPEDFMKYLMQRKNTATTSQLRIIEAAINDASKAPGAVVSPIMTPPVMIAASDLAVCIGNRELINSNAIKTEIIALRDIKNKVSGFLDKHKVKSFDDLDRSIGTLKTEHTNLKVKDMLDSLEAEGKILPAQRTSLVDMAKKDFNAFSDFIKTMPTLYKLNTAKGQIKPFSSGKAKEVEVYSNEEIHVANLMGKTPEEAYASSRNKNKVNN